MAVLVAPLVFLLGSEAPVSTTTTGGVTAADGGAAGLEVVAQSDLGTDFDVLTGFTFQMASGRKNLANALLRQFFTPAGFLAFIEDSPDYGEDIREWLNSPFDASRAAALASLMESRCRLDPRVLGARAAVDFEPSTDTLRIRIEIETAEGSFALVVAVSELSIEAMAETI